MALIPVVIFLYRWKSGTPFKTNVRSLAILAAAAFITVSPWLIRNYAVFHRVSFTSNAGVNFWMGNHSGASGAYSFPKENNPLMAVADDFDRSDLGFKLGFEFIRTHPLESVVIEGKKFAHFFAADYWLLMTMEYKPEWASAAKCCGSFRPAFDCGYPHPSPAVCRRSAVRNIWTDLSGGQRRKKFLFPSRTSSVLACRPLGFLCRRSLPVSDSADIYSCCRIRLVYFARKTFQRTKMRLLVFTLLCLLYIAGWLGEIFTLRSKAVSPPACRGTNFFKKRARR